MPTIAAKEGFACLLLFLPFAAASKTWRILFVRPFCLQFHHCEDHKKSNNFNWFYHLLGGGKWHAICCSIPVFSNTPHTSPFQRTGTKP
jgi:hypothetical protein